MGCSSGLIRTPTEGRYRRRKKPHTRQKVEILEEIITIKLFGQKYSFKAASGMENARAVAEFLMSEVDTVENQTSNQTIGMDKLTIVILAALNISGEYIELKKKYTDLVQRISERSSSIVRRIETNLQ